MNIREAITLAAYVEDVVLERPVRCLAGGWALRERFVAGHNMQMFAFGREAGGETEYALVNKGTHFYVPSDCWNNLTQYFGLSRDMAASINCAQQFVKRHPGQPITFVGHSKGGAEAAANAIATNCNAIVFNPMRLTLTRKMLAYLADYRGAVDVYAVEKDPLKLLFGWTPGIPGAYYLLPTLTKSPHWLGAIELALDSYVAPPGVALD